MYPRWVFISRPDVGHPRWIAIGVENQEFSYFYIFLLIHLHAGFSCSFTCPSSCNLASSPAVIGSSVFSQVCLTLSIVKIWGKIICHMLWYVCARQDYKEQGNWFGEKITIHFRENLWNVVSEFLSNCRNL